MSFRFDKSRAMKPVRVSWRLRPATVIEIETIAKREGVEPEDVAQQALDHVLARGRGSGKRQEAGGGSSQGADEPEEEKHLPIVD